MCRKPLQSTDLYDAYTEEEAAEAKVLSKSNTNADYGAKVQK
jgi:hypothetical protein